MIAYGSVAFLFFHWLDTKASPAAKKALIEWLRPVPHDPKAIVSAGLELFDRLYTKPLLSVSGFLRSSLFTVAVSCFVLYELYSYDRFSLHNVFEGIFEAPFFVIIIFYNILSDYVSLFVVRWWLAAGISGVRNLLVGPLVGIVIVALFVIVRGITWGIYYMMTELDQGDEYPFPLIFLAHFSSKQWIGITISAFIVHLWLPLLVLCIGLLKLLNYLRRVVGWTQWFFKGGKQHPLDAIGYVAAVIVFLGRSLWAFNFHH